MRVIAACEEADGTDWTVYGNDTDNLTVQTAVPWGNRTGQAVQFDKVNGAAGLTYAAVYKTIAVGNLATFTPLDRIYAHIYITTLTNVASTFIRLGSDRDTNYVEWRFTDTDHTINQWNVMSARLGDCIPLISGTGVDRRTLNTIVVGVIMDGEANTLTGAEFIAFDSVWLARVKPTKDD